MYRTIEFQEFVEKVKQESLNVLDVRAMAQFESGHIEGAVNIPLAELEEKLGELDKDKEYHVVCQLGIKSAKACDLLSSHGFKVVNVDKGMSMLDNK